MIKYLVGFVVRASVELGLVLFFGSALFVFFAYRIARRFVVDTPDRLDRLAGPLATGLALVARSSRIAGERVDTEPEYVETGATAYDRDERRRIGHDEWKDLTV